MDRSHTIEEAGQEMAARGIKNAVFVQCYNDCPEEIDWVYKQVSAKTKSCKVHFERKVKEVYSLPPRALPKKIDFGAKGRDQHDSRCLMQAEKQRFLKGVVGGLNLTKHEVMRTTIAKFSKETRPKFVGVRHLIDFEPVDFLTRPDVHAGLAILENHGLTFDLQVQASI